MHSLPGSRAGGIRVRQKSSQLYDTCHTGVCVRSTEYRIQTGNVQENSNMHVLATWAMVYMARDSLWLVFYYSSHLQSGGVGRKY